MLAALAECEVRQFTLARCGNMSHLVALNIDTPAAKPADRNRHDKRQGRHHPRKRVIQQSESFPWLPGHGVLDAPLSPGI